MFTAIPLPATDLGKLGAVIGLALALLYVLTLDQGLVMSAFQGDFAFRQNFIHELVHDARHLGGLPCH